MHVVQCVKVLEAQLPVSVANSAQTCVLADTGLTLNYLLMQYKLLCCVMLINARMKVTWSRSDGKSSYML